MPSVPSSQTPQTPWHNHITLDLLLHVLNKSIFHPAIILIFYLCLAAVPPHHHRHPLANPTLYYASFLLLIRLLLLLNHRITYGRPRKVNWESEVVIITGGATGLGRTIAELLLIKHAGVKVAIIDVKEADETARAWMRTGGEFEGRLWWGCIDVRNSAAVKIMAGRVKEELGLPTIVVNNAAMAVNGLPLVAGGYEAGLTSQQAERTLMVNATGNFNVLLAFLGDLMRSAESGKGATIVTVSSLLAHLNPARLADYNASKAALSSLHSTLTAEIAMNSDEKIREGVKTVLVEPGQIHTQLFADITDVPWYANFFGPILEVNEVAKAVVRQLESGESGVIRMPFYSKCMPVYGVMPGSVQKAMRWFSGIDKAIVPSKKKR
ncbi:hypothetical protein OHC33_002988 [Knufia fluminis]|uniref:Uncharacterized protein n=2 Tax=Knufia TaxID=430999 RepID=A0AAN8FDL3_9EURO|nr:hypothetical protein OHC33_002988 [Knufia fluminis]